MKLPLNCEATYFTEFITKEESKAIFDSLVNIYKISELNIKYFAGKAIEFDTGKLMFIDEDLHKKNKFPKETWGETAIWSAELLKVKEKIEKIVS